MRYDYTAEVSDDGYWKVYLIPDTKGYIGYLVYLGDAAGVASPGKKELSRSSKDDLNEEKIIELRYVSNGIENIDYNPSNKNRSRLMDLLTLTEGRILPDLQFYEVWASEYSDTELDLYLEIIWEKGGKRKKSTLSAKYDRFNIHKYWGLYLDYTWKRDMGIE